VRPERLPERLRGFGGSAVGVEQGLSTCDIRMCLFFEHGRNCNPATAAHAQKPFERLCEQPATAAAESIGRGHCCTDHGICLPHFLV